MADYLTVPQVSRLRGRPEWKVRRVVDNLGVDIPRIGLCRLIDPALLPEIDLALSRSATRSRGAKSDG
jgi:hypothetical protein